MNTKTQKVLIIAPTFAPQNFIGAFRMYRLAKYLPRFGWQPHVLTIDRNYSRPEDPALLEDLPNEVRIHTARYVEPTLRGIQMNFGGPDRTFSALQRKHVQVSGPENADIPSTTRAQLTIAHRVVGNLRELWLSNPDMYRLWYGPALRAARRLVHEEGIKLVVSTCPEYTGHRIAAELRKQDLRWIADYDDPASYVFGSPRGVVLLNQRRHELMGLKQADAVTVASDGTGRVFREMYRLGPNKDIRFIPTGIDVDLISGSIPTKLPFPYLLFPGAMTVEYGSEFLEVFATALKNPEVSRTGIHLLVVGNLRQNRNFLLPAAQRLCIIDRLVLRDQVPQREVISLLAGAKAGVLMPGRTARWWCLYAKAVEYMAMRKRVIALLPDLSMSRLYLERTGLGVFLDGDRELCAETLRDFILGRLPLPEINEAECERFTATRQAESFADLFERLLAE